MNFNINLGQTEPKAKTPSSIDRFFWTKSTKFFAGSINNFGMGAWIMTTCFGIAAVLFLTMGLLIKGFPMAFTYIFSPFALASLGLAIALEMRGKKPIQSEVKISANGRRLLHKIGNHIGWYDHDHMRGYQKNAFNDWWKNMFGIKTASDVLKPKSAELLDIGCSHYNRLTGLLKLGKDGQGRSSNMAPQIQAAGDEAMMSLLNQIGLFEDNPEMENVIVSQCSGQIEKLKELADRYEEIVSGPTTLADRLSSTTVMDSVLDQLRMEAQAHEELRTMDRQD